MPAAVAPSVSFCLVVGIASIATAAVAPATNAFATKLSAQQAPQPPSASDTAFVTLARALRRYVDADSIVGAAMLTAKSGRVLNRVNIGHGDRALSQPVTDATLFHWGSITKTLTAVAIMQLRDHGKLSLDDPITKWIPELRQLHDPYNAIDRITLRMLLSHSGGFRNGTWPYGDGTSWQPFEPTRWEQLVAMLPYQELLFAPGSRYGYSNPGFIYLARVIEAVTGDPWVHYVQKNIWTPLGLTRSYVNGTPYHLAADRSNNYDVVKDTTRGVVAGTLRVVANGRDFDPGITIPNGGWNAPLDDILGWASFLTDATNGDPAKRRLFDTILKRSSLDEMWKAVVPLDGTRPTEGAMGLSFFLYERGTERIVGHTGSQAGFRAFLWMNPRTQRVVVAVYNTSSSVRLPNAAATQREFNDAVFRWLEVAR